MVLCCVFGNIHIYYQSTAPRSLLSDARFDRTQFRGMQLESLQLERQTQIDTALPPTAVLSYPSTYTSHVPAYVSPLKMVCICNLVICIVHISLFVVTRMLSILIVLQRTHDYNFNTDFAISTSSLSDPETFINDSLVDEVDTKQFDRSMLSFRRDLDRVGRGMREI